MDAATDRINPARAPNATGTPLGTTGTRAVKPGHDVEGEGEGERGVEGCFPP